MKRFRHAITIPALVVALFAVLSPALAVASFAGEEGVSPNGVFGNTMETLSYDVHIDIQEDNTFNITENIEVNFIQPYRGIIRDLSGTVEAVFTINGEIVRREMSVIYEIIDAGGMTYETQRTILDNMLTVRVGDPVAAPEAGAHRFELNYQLVFKDDDIPEYDSVYLEVIPDFSDIIGTASVTISFPKDAELTDPEFLLYENEQFVSNDIMTVERFWPDESGKYTLKATLARPLNSITESVVFRAVLPEGYFVNEQYPVPSYAHDDEGMRTLSYDTSVAVQEDNSLIVQNHISVEFLESSRGIFWDMPYIYKEKYMADGEVVTHDRRMEVEILRVDGGPYTEERADGVLSVRIGDPDVYLTGTRDYVIQYRITYYDDGVDEFDSVYFQVIPDLWPDTIESASVEVSFPKDTDVSGAEFIGVENGMTSTDVMTVEKLPNILHAASKRPIYSGEGVAFRVVLPEGYFVGERRFHATEIAFWIVVICAPILCFVLWLLFGRDRRIVETVEFHPPEGFTSAEIGLLWDGKVQNSDMTSMILYWANKGFLTIEERADGEIWLHKVKDLPDDAKAFESTMYSRIFRTSAQTSIAASSKDISEGMYYASESLKRDFSQNRAKNLY
jgi:hypothetical protein